MTKTILLSLFLLGFFQVSAQTEQDSTNTGYDLIYSTKPVRGERFINRTSHFYFPVSFFSDITTSPMEMHHAPTGEVDSEGNEVYDNLPFQHLQWNLVTVGLGYRFNLKEINENLAFAIRGDVNLGLGGNSEVYGNDSTQIYFSIQAPILFQYYFGNTATFQSNKTRGFTVGLGVEINKLGLGADESIYPNNQSFIQPCGSLGFTYVKENKRGNQVSREFNIKGGMGPVTRTNVDGQGQPLTDKSQQTARSFSIKLSVLLMPGF